MKQKICLPIELPELAKVEEQLYAEIQSTPGFLGEICKYMLKAGGKRLRPTLVLLSAKCHQENVSPKVICAATAVELIHLASLIHDDVIDNSSSRHGKPTINQLWDNKVAILAGDKLYAKAFDILAKNGLYNILNLVVEAIEDMCSGEIEQALDSFNLEQEENSYYNKISKKTGKLIAVSCQSGSLAGEADEETALSLRNYGLNLGYAFQITDDILDFTGEEEILGKPVGSDLKQGTLTLPIIFLLHNPNHRSWVQNILKEKNISSTNRQKIIEALLSTGTLQKAKDIAYSYAEAARNCLHNIPATIYKETLQEIALLAIDRSC
ncbi:polyprenyl synthetase family protein [Bacillota bacterium LX-D]|nr:polyprenyl synthetase family protein [Bacillota bacterium LX-D]